MSDTKLESVTDDLISCYISRSRSSDTILSLLVFVCFVYKSIDKIYEIAIPVLTAMYLLSEFFYAFKINKINKQISDEKYKLWELSYRWSEITQPDGKL